MDRFYVGLHQASDAHRFRQCCIHVDRLQTRKKQLGCDRLLLDSRAFKTLEVHGDFTRTPGEYASAIERIATLVPRVVAVSQDYMCEPFMLDITGKTVQEHQQLTIARYDLIRAALDRRIYLMPVLQGYHPRDYVDHIRQYGDRLKKKMWVGVGSVCKRNGDPAAIRAVLLAIHAARPDLRLHGFGVKITALRSPTVRALLWSADSMAWSQNARKNGRNANDWREAERFALRCEARGPLGPLFQQEAA